MKTSKFFSSKWIVLAAGLVLGYITFTAVHFFSLSGTVDDCKCSASAAHFGLIPLDDAKRYIANYHPDTTKQKPTAILLTKEIIQSLKCMNDSLSEIGEGGEGVRIYFAATDDGAERYNSFVAIGTDDANNDVRSSSGQYLYVRREDRVTIDVCPKMCDTSSPLKD